MPINERHLDHLRPRRTVIACAGLGLLATVVAACSTRSKDTTTPPADASSSSAPGGAIAKAADVPVGSAVIVDDLVVTQATAGDFKGFSSSCTHSGCRVSKVTDGKIVCPCHGSEFNLDGTVAQGPAKAPLETKPISVQGDSIVAG